MKSIFSLVGEVLSYITVNLTGILMRLTEFEVLASKMLANNDEDARQHFLFLLNSSLLKSVVYNLVNNQQDLDEVASRSYYHDNGFLKTLLIDKRPKYSIRLHVWPDQPLEECDVHNHPWDMSGVVLNGDYIWPIYTLERTCNKGAYHDLYECSYLDDYSGHIFKKEGKAILNHVDTLIMRKGDFFRLPSTHYHSVKKTNSKLADSIVITADSEIMNAKVISNRGITCSDVLKNPSVNSLFLRQKLVSLLNRI